MKSLDQLRRKVKPAEKGNSPYPLVVPPESAPVAFCSDGTPNMAGAPMAGGPAASRLCYTDIKRGQRWRATPDTQTDGNRAAGVHAATSAAPSAFGGIAGGRVGVNSLCPAVPCSSVMERVLEKLKAAFPGSVVVDVPSLVCRDRVIQRAGPDQGSPSSSTPKHCERAIYLRGSCEHGELRWIMRPCGTRSCPVCGPVRRARIADRIKLGIEALAGKEGAGWFVGTFGWDIDKPAAVKVMGKFVRWVRKRLGRQVQYVSTWELTEKGRLHVNIVFAPWGYIAQCELAAAWRKAGGGRVVWIKRVGAGVSAEVVKVFFLARYLAKADQAVIEGRGVCYSRGWPKLLAPERAKRKGRVSWCWFGGDYEEATGFYQEKVAGLWIEVGFGEWAFHLGESCDCFQFEGAGPSPARAGPGDR